MAILIRADIGAPEEHHRLRIAPRYAVFLRLENGEAKKMLFEGTMPGAAPAFGRYGDTDFVRAYHPGFTAELRSWTASLQPVVAGSSCHPPKASARK